MTCGFGFARCFAVTLVSAVALLAAAGAASPGLAGDGPAASVKGIDPPGAAALIDDGKGGGGVTVIDVRTAEEYSGGHLEDAVNIDYYSESFKDGLSGLDKEATYVVYCRSGRRSEAAVEMMEGMGFTDLYHIEGGILGWRDSGLPVEK